jgi:peptidyl-tRNA hydrolase
MFENPELAGKEDAVKAKIVSDYKIDPDINDVESVEFTMNKKKMEQDAVEAKSWFQDLKGKVKIQSQSPEEMQQKKAEKMGQWKTAVQEVLGQVTKIPIPVWDGKEVKIIGDYEIKEDNRSIFIDPLTQAFASYELDDSNRRVVGQEFQERFIARNLPYIIDSAIKLKEAEIRSQIEAEYGGSVRRPNPPGGGGSTSGDSFEDYLNS